jgi:hypothetical protein
LSCIGCILQEIGQPTSLLGGVNLTIARAFDGCDFDRSIASKRFLIRDSADITVECNIFDGFLGIREGNIYGDELTSERGYI